MLLDIILIDITLWLLDINNLIIQWGHALTPSNDVITLAKSYTTSHYMVVAVGGYGGYNNANAEYDALGMPYNLTLTQFQYKSSGAAGKKYCQWISIGV